jgi:hypothetical protein
MRTSSLIVWLNLEAKRRWPRAYRKRTIASTCAERMRKGGQRIDGGVGDGGGVGACDVRSNGEGGWVGHAAGQQAAEIHKVHLQDARAKMPMSMSGTTVTHAPASSHCRPVALKTVAKNFAPAPRPGDPEEKRDEVRFVEFPERVADGSGGFVKIVGHTDNLRLVAKLQGARPSTADISRSRG